MKNNSLVFNLRKGVLAIFVFVGIFSSCKKSINNEIAIVSEDRQLYDVFIKAGISPDHIEDIGEYYVVEGDIRFKKNKTDLSKVVSYFGIGNQKSIAHSGGNGKLSYTSPNNKISQWRTPGVVSSTNVERIFVCSSLQYHYSIVNTAFKNWANIENCKINFYGFGARPVGTENSINVFVDNSINAYAYAEFPNSDVVGYQVRVNSNLFSNLTDAQKIYILTHEIGHCLGLRHTDLNTNGEGTGGAFLIPGTPSNDHYSIMNSGSYHQTVPSFTSMTHYDKVAVQYLYPFGSHDNWITYPSNKFPDVEVRIIDFSELVDVKWNKDLVQTSTVTIELYQFNQLVGVIGQNIPNSGIYSYPLALYAQQEWLYAFDLHLKIISDANPSIYDYSPLFRTWVID